LGEEVEEIVDEVDVEDRVIGRRALSECLAKGILHRAVAVYVWNSKNHVFLQRRSLSDDWFPGYWTSSCTGHVKSGEDSIQAAIREIREELGVTLEEPRFVLKFVVPPVHYSDLTEYEMMHVFEAFCRDRNLKPNPSEVAEGRFLSIEQFKAFFEVNMKSSTATGPVQESPQESLPLITPDAILSYRKYVQLKRFVDKK